VAYKKGENLPTSSFVKSPQLQDMQEIGNGYYEDKKWPQSNSN